MGKVRLGVSGWSYDGWLDAYYPEGVSRGSELEYLGGEFNSVEINGSFYSLLRPETYRRWYMPSKSATKASSMPSSCGSLDAAGRQSCSRTVPTGR